VLAGRASLDARTIHAATPAARVAGRSRSRRRSWKSWLSLAHQLLARKTVKTIGRAGELPDAPLQREVSSGRRGDSADLTFRLRCAVFSTSFCTTCLFGTGADSVRLVP